MSNKKEDLLHILIKSLSSSEKGYYKKFIKGFVTDNEKDYLKLFDIYDNSVVYDETILKDKLKLTFGNKRIDVFKGYLYESILKSLRAYNSNSFINISINELLSDVEILLKKGLFNLAQKRLVSAEKLAINYHKLKHLLLIKEFEKKIIIDSHKIKFFKTQINKLHNEEFKYLNQLLTFFEYNKIDSQAFLLNRVKPKARNENESKKFIEIIQNKFMSNIALADSIPSKFLFHTIYVTYYYAINNVEKSLAENAKIIDLFDNNILLKKEFHLKYTYSLHNQIAIATKLEKFTIASKYLDKLKSESSSYKRDKSKITEFIYVLELNLIIKSNKFENTYELILNIEKYISDDSNSLQNKIIIFHLLSIYYFEIKQYSNALKWTNNILNSNDIEVRTDLFSFAKILSIILHYELKNLDIIEYLLKSTKRYLENNNLLYNLEIIIINQFKLLIKHQDINEVVKLFKNLELKLNDLKNENQNADNFSFYIKWVIVKINELSSI